MTASLNERLLLGNGLCISPLKGQNENGLRSLRDVVFQIDNEKDLRRTATAISIVLRVLSC